jgi:hypothetical protein
VGERRANGCEVEGERRADREGERGGESENASKSEKIGERVVFHRVIGQRLRLLVDVGVVDVAAALREAAAQDAADDT